MEKKKAEFKNGSYDPDMLFASAFYEKIAEESQTLKSVIKDLSRSIKSKYMDDLNIAELVVLRSKYEGQLRVYNDLEKFVTNRKQSLSKILK